MLSKLRIPVNENDNNQGDSQALVTLVEYGDYQCPFCGKAYPVVKKLQEEFGDDLNFVFRNFALTQIHPEAFLAAVSSEAAAKQNAFWSMHDWLFENQSEINEENILSVAQQLSLNVDEFVKDQQSEEIKNKVESDFMNGMRSGVNATPSFFINGEKFEGLAVHITLRSAIQAALEQAGK